MPASPEFQPQVVVLDRQRWSFQENTKGNRLKKYCTPIGQASAGLEGVDGWFWKESDRKYPHEFGPVREGILLGVLSKRRALLIERLS